MGDFFIIAVVMLIIVVSVIGALVDEIKTRLKEPDDEEDEKEEELSYTKPKFKTLTDAQIEDIHSRGKITPEEKVEEWENLDLCAPGDAAGSAAWRCEKYQNHCHDCLTDFANEHDEYTSIYDMLKVANKPDPAEKC